MKEITDIDHHYKTNREFEICNYHKLNEYRDSINILFIIYRMKLTWKCTQVINKLRDYYSSAIIRNNID